MKKIGIFLVLLILTAIISLIVISAQDMSGLEEDADKLTDLTEKAQDKSYIQQGWKDLFKENKTMLTIINVIDKILFFLNPVSKIILGIDASLSWLFILAIIIMIFFYKYIRAMLEFSLLENKWVKILISFGITLIIGFLKIIKAIADTIIALVSLTSNKWFAIALIGIIILVIIIAAIFSKQLKQLAEKKKEAKKKLEEEINRKKLEIGAKVAESITKQ